MTVADLDEALTQLSDENVRLNQRLREAEARAQMNFETVQKCSSRIAQLERVLVTAAIPLEALNMDNGNGAKWMAPLVKQHVAEAVTAIRTALAAVEK